MKTKALVLVLSLGVAACGDAAIEFEDGMQVQYEEGPDVEPLGTEAQAVSNGPCGDAYHRHVRHVAIGDLAFIDVYYSPAKNRYCAVNMATAKTWNSLRGRAIRVDVGSNASRRADSGRYRVFAGPIYVDKAASGCLVISGSVQATETSDVGIGSRARICN